MESEKETHLWNYKPLGIDPELLEKATNVFKTFDQFLEWVNESPCKENNNPCKIQSEDIAILLYWQWVPSIKKAKRNKNDYYLENYIKCKGKPYEDNNCLNYYKNDDYLIIIMQNIIRWTSGKTVYKIGITEDDEDKVKICFNKMKKFINEEIYRF